MFDRYIVIPEAPWQYQTLNWIKAQKNRELLFIGNDLGANDKDVDNAELYWNKFISNERIRDRTEECRLETANRKLAYLLLGITYNYTKKDQHKVQIEKNPLGNDIKNLELQSFVEFLNPERIESVLRSEREILTKRVEQLSQRASRIKEQIRDYNGNGLLILTEDIGSIIDEGQELYPYKNISKSYSHQLFDKFRREDIIDKELFAKYFMEKIVRNVVESNWSILFYNEKGKIIAKERLILFYSGLLTEEQILNYGRLAANHRRRDPIDLFKEFLKKIKAPKLEDKFEEFCRD